MSDPRHLRQTTKGSAVLTDQQIRLYQALRNTVDILRRRAVAARHDERGAIPAEVAWIAGLVVLAIVVLGIITLITTTKASSIKLN
jgi:Flp pilus assembly pilin Flp